MRAVAHRVDLVVWTRSAAVAPPKSESAAGHRSKRDDDAGDRTRDLARPAAVSKRRFRASFASMSTRNVRRRLEQFLANPSCEANAASVALDVPMRAVAESEGHSEREAQSPYALRRGATFESALFDDEAQELRVALAQRRVLPSEEAIVHDLRLTRNRGPSMKTLDHARAAFGWWIGQANEQPRVAHVFIAPAIVGPAQEVIGEGILAPDLVIAHPVERGETRWELEIGEIKVYPDRGGHTDVADLAATRTQAGLYLFALRQWLANVAPAIAVRRTGFLVLSWAGTNRPSVHAEEDLEFRARAAERAIEQLRARPLPLTRERTSVQQALVAISRAPTNYREACLSFCPRAAVCHRAACAQQAPQALGDGAANALGEIDLARANALIDGAHTPANDSEQALAKRFASLARLVS